MFQLTLKDLYELEKVKDIKTRNKILNEAKDSRDLTWRIESHVNEARRTENKKLLVDLLKKLGLEPAPKSAEHEQYSGKWEVLKEYDLNKEPPKEVKVKVVKGAYYLEFYRSIQIIRKSKKEQKALSSEELKRKQIDKNKKEITAKIKELGAERKDFIQSIISGQIDAVKNEDEIREQIWRFHFEVGAGLYQSTMRSFFTGKHDYECGQEERELADKRVVDLNYTNSMLVSLHFATDGVGDISDWQGHFVPKSGDKLRHAYEILKPYGWTFLNPEVEQLLDGTHELYTKEAHDEKD